MNKYIKLIVPVALALTASASCSKLLDLPNPNALTSSTSFESEADINASLVGVYHSFYSGYYALIQSNQFSGQSDEMTSYSTPDLQQYIKHVYSNMAQRWNTVTWDQLYEQIARCNQVITYAENITEWKTFDKAQIVAQAKAVRAYDYYQLAMLYEVAPYVDYVAESGDQPSQSTFDFLCEKIIEDATEAYKTLPSSYQASAGYNGPVAWKDQYRVTKWFAACVLAKTYMNWGDYLKGGYHYAEALPIYKDIVENGGFSLTDDYTWNFRMTTENNSESIFEIQQELSSNGGKNYYGFTNNSATPSQSTWRWKFYSAAPLGWTDYNAENWTLPAFKNENAATPAHSSNWDTRLPATLFYSDIYTDCPEHVQWQTWTATEGMKTRESGVTPEGAGFGFTDWTSTKTYINKYVGQYKSWEEINSDDSEGTNTRIFRLGEIMVDYAECLAQTGDLAGAINVLDQVRQRAGLCKLGERQNYAVESKWTNTQTHETIDFNKDYGYEAFYNNAAGTLSDFMKVLEIESMKESCFECERFVDLRRWGISRDNGVIERAKARSQKYHDNFTPGRAWLPMPPTEVNNNPNLNQVNF